MNDDLFEKGAAVRRAVLGDAHVDRPVTGFGAPFREYVTRAAWGEVWARPGLDRRTRSCVTIALLAALHCEAELALHVAGGLRNGLTPAEIQEVLLHTAVYAGAPAANAAFAVADRVIAEPTRAEETG
jgi:4-carboxymuconolactone decarboxylase